MSFLQRKTAVPNCILFLTENINKKGTAVSIMKNSFRAINRKFSASPVIEFEKHSLTSFSGLVLLNAFFERIGFKQKLQAVFKGQKRQGTYRPWKIFLILILHVTLGYRRIRDHRFYSGDPLIKRLLGVIDFPDTATISRSLAGCDEKAVTGLRNLMRDEILSFHQKRLITLDFDGSVISTKRHAEQTAIGFNRSHKGRRSYYPLFCTVAQTGQVLDVLHRSGNVHDSNGSIDFVAEQLDAIWRKGPNTRVESRMDSAFFSQEMVDTLNNMDIDFTISVPFHRFTELKLKVEKQSSWEPVDNDTSYFECEWKPASWKRAYRFIFIRRKNKLQYKQPLQLDLFLPAEFTHEYKVIATNMKSAAFKAIAFHNGRGSQEGVIGELKSDAMLDYIPFRRLVPNKLFLLAAAHAHNLSRQFQMVNADTPHRKTDSRTQIAPFEKLSTMRKTLFVRAGRLTRPHNVLTLTISATDVVKELIINTYDRFRTAA
jgi:hypothetical protein